MENNIKTLRKLGLIPDRYYYQMVNSLTPEEKLQEQKNTFIESIQPEGEEESISITTTIVRR